MIRYVQLFLPNLKDAYPWLIPLFGTLLPEALRISATLKVLARKRCRGIEIVQQIALLELYLFLKSAKL